MMILLLVIFPSPGQNGAKTDAHDEVGCTALFHAVRQGHQTATQLLLESGTNLEIK